MMPTIRISERAYQGLKQHAIPFEDTPNDVIERLLGLLPSSTGEVEPVTASGRTRQELFRPAIQKALRALGGEATKNEVLAKVPDFISLTEADKQTDSRGRVIWRYRCLWEASAMRKDGLLHSPKRGVWKLPFETIPPPE